MLAHVLRTFAAECFAATVDSRSWFEQDRNSSTELDNATAPLNGEGATPPAAAGATHFEQPPPVTELVAANLAERNCRHLMLLTRNLAALQLLFGCGLLREGGAEGDEGKVEVLFGSVCSKVVAMHRHDELLGRMLEDMPWRNLSCPTRNTEHSSCHPSAAALVPYLCLNSLAHMLPASPSSCGSWA